MRTSTCGRAPNRTKAAPARTDLANAAFARRRERSACVGLPCRHARRADGAVHVHDLRGDVRLALRTGAINLGQGFPDTDGPASLLADAAANVTGGVNQYPPGIGVPALRAAVAEHQQRFYGLDVDPDDVLITTGATEAIAAAVLALCEPGDEVVTFQPYYDSYAATIALLGRHAAGGPAAAARLSPSIPTSCAPRSRPHPRGAGQLPAQPDRRRPHPRAAHHDRCARRRVRRGGRHRRGLRAHDLYDGASARPDGDPARHAPSAR